MRSGTWSITSTSRRFVCPSNRRSAEPAGSRRSSGCVLTLSARCRNVSTRLLPHSRTVRMSAGRMEAPVSMPAEAGVATSQQD